MEQVLRWLTPVRGAAEVGAVGRRLLPLLRKRQPVTPMRVLLDYGRFPAYFVVMLWLTARYGGAVAQASGVPPSRQLAQQLKLILRAGINPKIYYFLELYRTWSDEAGRHCVMRHEIKTGLLKALHKMQPKRHGRRVSLGHKLDYADCCVRHGLPVPQILALGRRGTVEWLVSQSAAGMESLFLKPEISRGARGARWFKKVGAARYRAQDGRCLALEDVARLVARRSRRKTQMLQGALENHPTLTGLAQDSLIVFRVFTCLDRTGVPVVTHAMIRILSKLEPGWNRSDEFAAPVDISTGVLGLMCGDKAYGPSDWYACHPVTGAPVAGRMIEDWSAVRELARAGHRVFSDRLLLGWDVALTTQGAILVEANAYPDTEFLQRVHRRPIGESPLGPLLAHHLERLAERLR